MTPPKAHSNINRKQWSHDDIESQLSKLVHAAKKEFHKQGKVVKAFECQKVIKKMKALKDNLSEDEQCIIRRQEDHMKNETRDRQSHHRLELKLASIKAFQLDSLVYECLRRVGLLVQKSNSSLSSDSKEAKTEIDKEYHQVLIEDLLSHKRMKETIERWNQKHAEFRARTSRNFKSSETMDASLATIKNHTHHQGKRKRTDDSSNSTKLKKTQHQDLGFSNLFVDSLSGKLPELQDDMSGDYDDDAFYMNLNEDNDGMHSFTHKKNRMGQKQRKAKAMAIEAKKTGKAWNKSINWRAKKTNEQSASPTNAPKEKSSSGLSKGVPIQVADVIKMGTSWKEEGKAHPSWAAREALKAKTSIVAFQGKKITFE